MENKLSFVQFIHPGSEHIPDKGRFKGWNKGPQKQVFLKQAGRYLLPDQNTTAEGELLFWANWEPDAEVKQQFAKPLPGSPSTIYSPHYALPNTYQGFQATDPFIFGHQFHYLANQQAVKTGLTPMRYLERGSVILFGSCRNKRFILDTVFVTNHWISHNKRNYKEVLRRKISTTYAKTALLPFYQNDSGADLRLYCGATFDKPLHGMYSFFPCALSGEKPMGFARPTIKIRDVINDNLLQGRKMNPQTSLDAVKSLWDEVVKQVTDQGLKLGVFAALPKPRKA